MSWGHRGLRIFLLHPKSVPDPYLFPGKAEAGKGGPLFPPRRAKGIFPLWVYSGSHESRRGIVVLIPVCPSEATLPSSVIIEKKRCFLPFLHSFTNKTCPHLALCYTLRRY